MKTTPLKEAQLKLIAVKLEKNLTNEQIANIAGVDVQSITKFPKQSARLLSMGVLTKIYKFLELELPAEFTQQKETPSENKSEQKKERERKKNQRRRDLEDLLQEKRERNYYDYE